MREAVLQAVIEVPMSRRQALAALKIIPRACAQFDLEEVSLTGHSILRGLTFLEFLLRLPEDVDLRPVSQAALAHFVIEAEGVARAGESEEFALAFAEVFWAGREHEPEAVLLPEQANALGIGGTSERQDFEWAVFLSRFYNPAARSPGEVQIRRRVLR